MKNHLKLNEPVWPATMHLLTSGTLESLDLTDCKLTKFDSELLTNSLTNNPIGACNL